MALWHRLVGLQQIDVLGYELRTDPDTGERWICERSGECRDLHLPNPDLHPPGVLHRRFAALFSSLSGELAESDRQMTEADEERVLAFAESFGLLGYRQPDTLGLSPRKEALNTWALAAVNLLSASMSWDIACSGSVKLMSEHIEALDGKLPRGRRSKASLARYLKEFVVDKSAQVLLSHDVMVHREPAILSSGRVRIRDQTSNLLAFLWMEFVYSLERESEEMSCEICGEGYVVDNRRGTRRSRKFCSDRCRATAHRRRRQRAVQLSRKGLAPGKIAKELDTDAQTVRGWIKKATDRRKK